MIIQFCQKAIGNLKCLPGYIAYQAYDRARYYYQHDYLDFYEWGIHLFVGRFGKSKTSSMVIKTYELCCQFPQLFVLTNMSLFNFPEHTKILPLRTVADIINAPDYCIVLIDEIATVFNNRDFMKYKEKSLNKNVFQSLSQCRHRHIMIFGTATKYKLCDRQLLDITATVTECSIVAEHPFSRKITDRQYDADDYDIMYNNPLYDLDPLNISVFLQTNKYRGLYDTKEMVVGFLEQEDTGENNSNLSAPINITYDKSISKKIKKQIRKHNR